MGYGRFQAKFRMKKIQILVLLILGSLILTYITIWYLPIQSTNKLQHIKPSLGTVQDLMNILQSMNLLLSKMDKFTSKPVAAKFMKFPAAMTKQSSIQPSEKNEHKRTVLIAGHDLQTGYLKHVVEVFQHYGYLTTTNKTSLEWDILWHHDYPFVDPDLNLSNLIGKKVNHFPGSGFITNKVTLMEFKDGQIRPIYLPIAFSHPKQAKLFSEYAMSHPNSSWVMKGNDHRGIQVLQGSELKEITKNVSSSQSGFIQLFVPNPFLIDARKFDIGLYVAVTSMDPLKVYAFYGDILFRFCPLPYYPFDPALKDKYVVADDYTPVWEMPSLKEYYTNHGATFKSALASHFAQLGLDVGLVWAQIDHIVRDTLLRKRDEILAAHGSTYERYLGGSKTFFEMVRFDFILDDHLSVHLMEVNMSPNLSSDHFPPNSRLYKRLLNDLLHLLGLVYAGKNDSDYEFLDKDFQIFDRDLSVFSLLCANHCQIQRSCDSTPDKIAVEVKPKYTPCQVCFKCWAGHAHTYKIFAGAFLEHSRKQSFRRILPPMASSAIDSKLSESPYIPISINPIKGNETKEHLKMVENLFAKNERTLNRDALLHLWFVGKCLEEGKDWCF